VNHYEGYRITSPYGQRISPINNEPEKHTGIDLAKSDKSDIHAFVEGLVVHASFAEKGSGVGGFGNAVCIVDKNKKLHLYGHLNSCSVKINDKVSKGQKIGTQGNTGQSAGSHLHYEVRTSSTPSFGWRTDINPTEYLDEYYKSDNIVEKKLDWKEEALKFLQEEYGIDKTWKATDTVNFAILGAILSKKEKK
jgi:murein DD-endopeptidase MepM/ murein hydrolase activator NlpD